MTIRIEIQTSESKAAEPSRPEPNPEAKGVVTYTEIAPGDSNRVFVDVTAYNSKFYYVQGDIAAPGKMHSTGHDTVLDALNYAGGLIPTGSPADIRLVRPARGGKPEKVFPIDLAAITEKGDKRLNYQVFPGDRIVVMRSEMVKTTILADRIASSLQTLANAVVQGTALSRALVQATPDLTPVERLPLIRKWFEIASMSSHQPGGPRFDEELFRELWLYQLKSTPPATVPSNEKK